MIVVPLWGKLVLLSVAKKGLVLTTAYLYGIPRLYRRSQKLLRYVIKDPLQRSQYQGYVRSGFRLPARLLHLQPKTYNSPAYQYLQELPERLLPSSAQKMSGQPTRSRAVDANRLQSIKTSFASSPLLARHSQKWAARREKLTSLREKFSGNVQLQNMVRDRAKKMLNTFSNQPFSFVPGIRLAT